MFAISFGKILFTILVIVAVVLAVRMIGRRNEAASAAPRKKTTAREPAVEDMTPCAVCGAYVAATSARGCGRAGCPYK